MKKSILASTLITAVLSIGVSNSAFANKPAWAGQGKPTAEQKQSHRDEMQSKKASQSQEQKRESHQAKMKHAHGQTH
ncbi:MAG: hypothetical protein GXO35_05425 [Gammaproteobacteria bacterium]|nr:hypothetical protein [Gammaproteobacteria bacterium]